jgi:hypothetical protein
MQTFKTYKIMLTLKEINEKKAYGDISIVARMIGMSDVNVGKSLKKPHCRRLAEICEAFTKVIKAREKLIG